MKQITLLLCLLSAVVFAQRPKTPTIEITGTIIETETKQPLEYATIALTHKKSGKLLGEITDEKGNFSVEVPKGFYDIQIEFIGFETKNLPSQQLTTNKNLGIISLSEDNEQLEEIEIVAEKTTTEIKLDKKIYNVGKDLTLKGGNASDVLDNVPSVTIDSDGAVSLRGNGNVRILIDGKPSALVGLNGADALKNLPADAIQKVEVVTSPSARYDAEGTAGILNIILRKGKITGFNGSVSVTTGIPDNHRVSTNLNYRTKKFNIFSNIGYAYRKPPGNADFSSTNFNADGSVKSYLDQTRDYDRTKRAFTPSIGLEYYINKKSSITGQFNYKKSDDDDLNTNTSVFYDADRMQTNTSIRLQDVTEKEDTYQYSLNYTNNIDDDGQKLNVDVQFSNGTEDEATLITSDAILTEKNKQITDNESFLFQIDYVLPIGKGGQLELGQKVDLSDTHSDFEVRNAGGSIPAFDPSNEINFQQLIYAYYAQYGKKYDKFSYLLGLRAEQTEIELELLNNNTTTNKDYLEWFPTVNLGYKISEKTDVTLGYNRRLRRPRRWFLNPFESRTSNTFVFKGNPDLDPTFTNAFDLGYATRIGKLQLTSSIYYQNSSQNIDVLSRLEDRPNVDVPVEVHQPYNTGGENRYGFEMNVNYSPAKWARLSGSFNYFNYKTEAFNYQYTYNGTSYNELLPSVENGSWFARLSSKITLPAKIEWQTRMMYRGKQEQTQSTQKEMFSIDLGFSKDLLKEKATISFSVNDVFNSRVFKKTTYNPNRLNPSTISDLGFQWRERSFALNFTYRFNQKKKRGRPKSNFGGDGGEGY